MREWSMNLPRLKDETEFERLALDTATPLVVPQYGWVDLRKGPPADVGFICGPITEGGSERFAATLRPLLFGGAWKVLDRVVECAFPPRDKHWTNSAKANRAKTLDVPVWAPFKKTDPEWQAALWLYAATEQLRDGMTHRRAEVTASGELRVPDEDPQSTTVHTLTPEEQFAFCRAAQQLIEAILAGSITPRAHEDLAFQLGLLQRFSGLAPAPGATEMNTVCEVHVNLREVGPDCVELDVPALQPTMQHQVGHRRFDLVAYLPNSADVQPLIGRLETAAVEVIQFNPVRPPRWLSPGTPNTTP